MTRARSISKLIPNVTGVNVVDYGALTDASEDSSVAIQEAMNTGLSVFFPTGEYLAHGLTQSTNYQRILSGGDVRIIKNANGTLFASTGTGVELQGIKFYGDAASPVYTGDNATFTGANCSMFMCGSRWAYGRAVKCTGDHFQIVGTNDIYQTADSTSTGYDIELGVSGTATLYHEISGIYTSQATGGIKMIDVGGSSIISGQFGKLTVASGTSPAGVNGGMVLGARILGNVVVEIPNAVFSGNQFGAISVTFASGTSGCSLGTSNIFAVGSSVVNNGNISNHIERQQGTGSTYNVSNIKHGADSGTGALDFREVYGTGSPETNVTAGIGSRYYAVGGGASTTLYVKTSGTGNTGWTAK